MEREQYRATAMTVLRIVGFVLGSSELSTEDLHGCDMELLYKVAKHHQLTALTARGLQKLGLLNEPFKLAYAKAKRKSLLFDAELSRVLKRLEDAHIRCMPLKGMLLKELYPGVGLREMSDIDILYDRNCRKAVQSMLTENGYTESKHRAPHHDVYRKPPFFLLEMHHDLFDADVVPVIYQYYHQKNYAVDKEHPFRFVMKPEEVYAYLIAHTYVHYITAGTGLKGLVDVFVFLHRYEPQLDQPLLSQELEALRMTEFEEKVRTLAHNLFKPEALTSETAGELDYFIFSGVYGNQTTYLKNKIKRKAKGSTRRDKLQYIKLRLTVSDQQIKSSRFFSAHPRMVWMMRVSGPFTVLIKPKRVIKEIRLLKDVNLDK